MASGSANRVVRVDDLIKRGSAAGVRDELSEALAAGEDSASWIVYQIGKHGFRDAAPLVVGILQHPQPHLRRRAAHVLGMLKDPNATEALMSSALGDRDLATACWAADSLGEIGSPEAVQALISTLKRPEGRVRRAAAASLARLGAREAVDSLIAAREGSNWVTRRALDKALATLERVN